MLKGARRIVEKLHKHGFEAYFAGGWVRDFLLKRKPKDIDIATGAAPEQVRRIFPNSRAIGAQFGVVQVRLYGHSYEVATFRSESEYLDGRHPGSVIFSDSKQDALRRDFTINGLFYDPITCRVIDHVRGEEDIGRKVIRTIGDPEMRFGEDKLRMLRAIRLACELGFCIAPDTWNAIRRLAPGILQVSWERIRDELIRTLTSPDPATGLDLLQESGLLAIILPEIEGLKNADPAAFTRTRGLLASLRRPSAVTAIGALLQYIGSEGCEPPEAISERICRRLKMSNEEIRRIVAMTRTVERFSGIREWRKSELKRFLRRPDIADLLKIFRAHCSSTGKDADVLAYCQKKLKEYKEELGQPPLLDGDDLIALGYSPGPEFGKILTAVEDLQLEGILQTKDEAIAHIKAAYPLPDSRKD